MRIDHLAKKTQISLRFKVVYQEKKGREKSKSGVTKTQEKKRCILLKVTGIPLPTK